MRHVSKLTHFFLRIIIQISSLFNQNTTPLSIFWSFFQNKRNKIALKSYYQKTKQTLTFQKLML